MKKKITKYFKLLVSVVLLFYLFYFVLDLSNLILTVKNTDPGYISLAFLSLIMILLSASYRWKYVISIQNRKISFISCTREYLIGAFFNNFMPGSIGGDLVRIVGASKEIGSKEIAFSSVLVERVIGLISMVAIGLCGFIYLNMDSGAGYVGLSLIILLMLFLGLSAVIFPVPNGILCDIVSSTLPEKISGVIISYLKDLAGYSSSPFKLIVVFLISFGFKAFDGFFVYFTFKSLGIGLGYIHALTLFSIINVIKMLPISFNGLGLSAVSWVLLMRIFGIDENLAASVDFLTITMSLIISIIGGVLYSYKTRKN